MVPVRKYEWYPWQHHLQTFPRLTEAQAYVISLILFNATESLVGSDDLDCCCHQYGQDRYIRRVEAICSDGHEVKTRRTWVIKLKIAQL